MLGIDIGQFTALGSQKDARDLLEELEVTYPAGFTNDSNIIRDYKVLGMPTTVFITAKGEIFNKWTGALTSEILVEKVEEMLAE
jgi:thiol:disulfide interchange protein